MEKAISQWKPIYKEQEEEAFCVGMEEEGPEVVGEPPLGVARATQWPKGGSLATLEGGCCSFLWGFLIFFFK
jgi:hypothetical protein